MAKKPRRDEVQKIIKNLLDSEIPETQIVAKQLADRIRQLEEHGLKLQDYVTQIENLATEEAEALVESKISELLKDLGKALGELRQRTRGAVSKSEVGSGVEERAKAEEEAEVVAEEVEELEEESEAPPSGVGVETYTTPEGFVVRKLRR